MGHLLPVLEVLVFYSPTCKRCRRVKSLVADAARELRGIARFRLLNVKKSHVRLRVCPRYGVKRIPSIVVKTQEPAGEQVYFVGVPDLRDLVGTVAYLSVHPEGGEGLES